MRLGGCAHRSDHEDFVALRRVPRLSDQSICVLCSFFRANSRLSSAVEAHVDTRLHFLRITSSISFLSIFELRLEHIRHGLRRCGDPAGPVGPRATHDKTTLGERYRQASILKYRHVFSCSVDCRLLLLSLSRLWLACTIGSVAFLA